MNTELSAKLILLTNNIITMKNLILTFFFIGMLITCTAQKPDKTIDSKSSETIDKNLVQDDQERYASCIKEAWQLYKKKDFAASALKYEEGFEALDGKAYNGDRYNAACSYALSENKDKAFYHLNRLADGPKYSNLGHITTDTDLNYLHSDERWTQLIHTVRANKEFEEKDLDKPLVAQLARIHTEDQTYRKEIGEIEKEFGWESDEMKAHWKLINEKDSLNLIEVTKIIDSRGWLGKDVIGKQGNSTLFLVIQHADINTQLKYLPIMRKAVKDGNARASSLALLEDRVALGQGKRQIYGSQIHTDQETKEMYVAPLVDPENVDTRRAEVGLGKLSDYVGHWDLTWDIDKHKQRTAKIEAMKKK